MLDDWREWSTEARPLAGRRLAAARATAVLFLAAGLLLGALAWRELQDGEPGLRLGLGAFLAVWVGGCAFAVARLARRRREVR